MALLVRDMEFRKLELRQIAATLVGAAVGIGLAIAGFGAWAIVGQLLGEAVTSTVLLWLLTAWRPSLAPLDHEHQEARRLRGQRLRREHPVAGVAEPFASVLIGRVLGAAALGTYALATTVILMPFARIAAPLQQVFFPAFSRIKQ